MWHDDCYDDDGNHWDNDDHEDKFFGCYDGYQKHQAQKASIKEELMPITWHPSRYWDWCMLEDEKKKKQKNYGHKHRSFLYLMTEYKKRFDLKKNNK